MSRRLAIALGALVFLVVCVVAARWLTTEGRERSAVLSLLKVQAAGDVDAVVGKLHGCPQRPGCVAQARLAVARTKRPGEVKILLLQSGTGYAVGSATGVTRVAWTIVDGGLPVVQRVTVRRTGNALFGREIVLERLSPPIDNEAAC